MPEPHRLLRGTNSRIMVPPWRWPCRYLQSLVRVDFSTGPPEKVLLHMDAWIRNASENPILQDQLSWGRVPESTAELEFKSFHCHRKIISTAKKVLQLWPLMRENHILPHSQLPLLKEWLQTELLLSPPDKFCLQLRQPDI